MQKHGTGNYYLGVKVLNYYFSIRKVDPTKPVLVAGDPERQHMAKSDKNGGIAYHPNQVKFFNEIAERLKIEPPKIVGTLAE